MDYIKFKIYVNKSIKKHRLPKNIFYDFIKKGYLEKYKEGYRYSEKYIRKRARDAKHMTRRIYNPWYKLVDDIYCSIRKLFR